MCRSIVEKKQFNHTCVLAVNLYFEDLHKEMFFQLPLVKTRPATVDTWLQNIAMIRSWATLYVSSVKNLVSSVNLATINHYHLVKEVRVAF